MILKSIWGKAKILGSIALIIYLFDKFGAKGMIYFLVCITLVIIIRIATSWDEYMLIVKSTETKIWGRPLDKKYGKPPKVKVGWGKK